MFIVSWSMESSRDCVSVVKQDLVSKRKAELQITIFLKLLFLRNSLYSQSPWLTDFLKRIRNSLSVKQAKKWWKQTIDAVVVRTLQSHPFATLATTLLNCSYQHLRPTVFFLNTVNTFWFVLAGLRIDGPFELAAPSYLNNCWCHNGESNICISKYSWVSCQLRQHPI